MIDKIILLIKENNISVPKVLLNSYVDLKITSEELIVLIYLINSNNTLYNPKAISDELKLPLNNVLELINNLITKGIISVDVKTIGKIKEEHLNLDVLYQRLAFIVINGTTEEKPSSNIYDIFEQEFGRTLSPIEYELISSWLEQDFNEELIVLALKEAVFNGVTHLRYIDKILYSWQKKGIKTKDDVEKERINYGKKKQAELKDIFEYDWLNDKDE